MTIKTMDILFYDLNREAQQEYLELIEADNADDVNTDIPIAVIEVESDGEN